MVACYEESSSGSNNNTDDDKSFSALCVNSGGVLDEDSCVCGGIKCDAGDLCNTNTKACPVHVSSDPFKQACTESGGTPDGSVCTCGGEKCAAFQLCVDNKCPKQTEPAQPTEYTTCINDDNSVGWLNKCKGSDCEKTKCEVDVKGTKTPVSCHGNQCGSCLNNVNTCENNSDHEQAGELYSCREGQKIKIRTCKDNVSCLEKTCQDSSCIDEALCGECAEGSFKCENGNVAEDTVVFPYSGAAVKISKGFITGLRSKCIHGRWTKLALDDKENCNYLNLKFNEFYPEQYPDMPHIDVGNKTVLTVFGYNYRGSFEGQNYYLAMCADDGVNCGECLYSFSYCSDRTHWACKNGRIETEQCPSLTETQGFCATNNTCFPPNTSAYCASDSCQNCKSICNW